MNLNYVTILNIAKQGNWEKAHHQIQPGTDPMACLVHAYLHRVEGDIANAKYWYKRAGTSIPDITLEQEWERLHALVQEN
ncbi:hypothetical protein AU255_15975 [Methyloprofundus sedimenti]|uniref:Uncharacterized protein n=1 Tax=Methyloprofundus sedimenti TaxID=1420851 RepID=A0A1V8M2G6_9GAMM|nr:hypothetical protein [Methyloprofundus sedimenti]OQK15708.1 hypothetical protein AU255_15975 [Methyloprofundus sedimenti]